MLVWRALLPPRRNKTSPSCIRRIQLEKSDLLHFLDGRKIGERRIQEIVGFAREKFQRKFLGLGAVTGFIRWNELHNRVQSLGPEGLIVKFSFAARRGKISLRE